MEPADIYRFTQRYKIDRQIQDMRERIVEERREQIGRLAARQEAEDVTYDWYRAQYERIENEVNARWGVNA